MNHQRAHQLLSDYLDDGLRGEDRAQLEAHCADCIACARELSELRQTVALLRGMPAAAAPSGLADEIMARVRAGEANPSRAGRLLHRFADPGTGLALAACLTGLVVLAALQSASISFAGRSQGEVHEASSLSGLPSIPGISPRPQRIASFSRLPETPANPALEFPTGPGQIDAALNRLLFNPEGFVIQQRSLPTRERSRMLSLVARRAVERDAVLEAIYRLQSVEQPGALNLAQGFQERAEAAIPEVRTISTH